MFSASALIRFCHLFIDCRDNADTLGYDGRKRHHKVLEATKLEKSVRTSS